MGVPYRSLSTTGLEFANGLLVVYGTAAVQYMRALGISAVRLKE